MRRITEVPEPWAGAMIAAGMVDGRYSVPVASLSALARATSRHTTTISRMVRGEGDRRDPRLVADVARALGQSRSTVARWIGDARETAPGWSAPEEANLLTEREQRALTEMIRAMVAARAAPSRSSLSVVRGGVSPLPADAAAAPARETGHEGHEGESP